MIVIPTIKGDGNSTVYGRWYTILLPLLLLLLFLLLLLLSLLNIIVGVVVVALVHLSWAHANCLSTTGEICRIWQVVSADDFVLIALKY